VNVEEEGIYGFRVVVTNGAGMGGKPPASGDLPDLWVGVDLTKPTARIVSAQQGVDAEAGSLIISWQADDKNACRPARVARVQPEPRRAMAADRQRTGEHRPLRLGRSTIARRRSSTSGWKSATRRAMWPSTKRPNRSRSINPVRRSAFATFTPRVKPASHRPGDCSYGSAIASSALRLPAFRLPPFHPPPPPSAFRPYTEPWPESPSLPSTTLPSRIATRRKRSVPSLAMSRSYDGRRSSVCGRRCSAVATLDFPR